MKAMKSVVGASIAMFAVCFPIAASAADARFSYYRYEGRSHESAMVRPGPAEFTNPIISGYSPDPSVERVGDDYYLVTSSFAHFPGLPVYHSKDLVTWTQIGNAIDRPGQVDFTGMRVSEGLMAPAISYHDGLFYIVCTNRKNFVITAKNPAGPWSDPVYFEFDGIDPSIFWDEDGKAYIVNNGVPSGTELYDGHRSIWIQEFDAKSLAMVGPRIQLINGGPDLSAKPFWIEAPHLYRREGYYYLIAAEGGTGSRHSEVVFRSRSVMGTYEAYAGNPILTQRDLPDSRPNAVGTAGHADFVQTPDGKWWSVFLATRNYGPDLYNIGRETWLLPVTWKDGWPLILEKGKPAPFVSERPGLPAAARPSQPLNGDFSYTDEFSKSKLGFGWMSVRIPSTDRYSVGGNELILKAGPGVGDVSHVPSFFGRKQAHAVASVSTMMKFAPEKPGDRAGLLAMQSDDAYLFLGVELRDGRPVVVLSARKSARGPQRGETLSSSSVPATHGPIYLKLSIEGGTLHASYATGKDQWKQLGGKVDATFLSTKLAGGFVGTVVGLYNENGD